MKKFILSTITGLLSLCSCGYLDDYSQTLVVVSQMSDLDELLIGDVYIESKIPSGGGQLAYGDPGWFLLTLDDDINTTIFEGVGGSFHDGAGYELLKYNYYGYTTWQQEVGLPYTGGTIGKNDALWNDFYRRINICNIILDEIDKLPINYDDEQVASLRIKGETHFLRAYFYLILNNVHADMYEPDKAATTLGVPLKLTAYVEHDKEKDTQFERTPLDVVYAQIVDDLRQSIEYFDQSPQTHDFYRTSGKAARVLLSRVYLYMQEWQKAREVLQDLFKMRLSLRNYVGLNKEDNVIIRENPEILFSTGSLNSQNSIDGKLGDFCVSEDLYDLYDDDDTRKNLFFTRESTTGSLALTNKYRHALHVSYVSDLNIIRVSEAYLNMAEACAMLGDVTEAHRWLNDFRRYRIDKYQDQMYDAATLVSQIRDERRKEFCFECGHRWFDLRRYAVNTLYPYSKTIQRQFGVYNGQTVLTQIEIYQLEEHDQAYTFMLPRSVKEFDTGMPDNETRPKRDPLEIIFPSTTN